MFFFRRPKTYDFNSIGIPFSAEGLIPLIFFGSIFLPIVLLSGAGILAFLALYYSYKGLEKLAIVGVNNLKERVNQWKKDGQKK